MLDNTKFLTYNQDIIERVIYHPDFIECKPKNNNYHSLKHRVYGVKLSLDFRKVIDNGKLIGFRHLEINISPHYHFNNYRHNGNDLEPEKCIMSVKDIITYLNIKPNEFDTLKVVNLEFGVNVNYCDKIENLINGIYYHKKAVFRVGNFPYFKKTETTSYKQIKAYAKGLQFMEFPEYVIDRNVFRFEVKTKQSKNIKKYGIISVNDLLNIETYKRLAQVILNEWESVLVVNFNPNYNSIKDDEGQFIKQCTKVDFWHQLKDDKNRNKFNRYKEKYNRILDKVSNLHRIIKLLIIDKIYTLQSGANSTQKNTINTKKIEIKEMSLQLINLENAPPHQNNTLCLVTGLDISMQKKGSKYLGVSGLKYYYNNLPQLYYELRGSYLSSEKYNLDVANQLYYIAHNIRNVVSNKSRNRRNFEKNNYNPKQMVFSFP